ncbi:MAG: hypothetical protein PHR28_02135 [candidate division Zixibacteria bacterium]|nr:hypothetical protein [candidate division Zixibacteria bacterium]
MRKLCAILMAALLASLTGGCSEKTSPIGIGGTNVVTTDVNAGLCQDELPTGYPQVAPVYTSTLPNGATVEILSIERRTDSSIVHFRYWHDGNDPVERHLAIPLTMLGVVLYDQEGQPIFGYDFSLQSENQVLQAVWTSQDRIEVIYTRNGPGVALDLSLNGNTHAIEFASYEEVDLAVSLFTEFSQSPTRELSAYEEQLLQRYTSMMEFLGDGASLRDNMDADVTEQLMLDNGFLRRHILDGEVIVAPTLAGCGIIGDIAAVVSVSCFFPPGPWTVVCVPAAGVSLACGLAGILGAIFD